MATHLRGMLPEGISSERSCTRTFWKSTKSDESKTSWKLAVLSQAELRQHVG
jgi:hypothetical protein